MHQQLSSERLYSVRLALFSNANHVIFPGVGTHDILMSAFDQVPVVPGLFQYEAPVLLNMSSFLFPTDNGVPLQLFGYNFGPPTVNPPRFLPVQLPLQVWYLPVPQAAHVPSPSCSLGVPGPCRSLVVSCLQSSQLWLCCGCLV